jgi:hypothetical protein
MLAFAEALISRRTAFGKLKAASPSLRHQQDDASDADAGQMFLEFDDPCP